MTDTEPSDIAARLDAVEDLLDNVSGLERAAHLEIIALREAVLAVVAALAEVAPATRTIIADDLQERLDAAFTDHPAIAEGDLEPPDDIIEHIRFGR